MRALSMGSACAAAIALTGCGEWGEPQLIDRQDSGAPDAPYFGPRIAVGPGGDAAIVYTHQMTELRASRGDVTWSTPVSVGEHTTYRDAHDVAVLSDGSAMTVFSSPEAEDLLWSRQELGVWTTAQRFPENSGARAPRIVADGSGRALAVWVGASGAARSARFLGVGWGAPHSIGIGDVNSLRLAMSPSGYGIAAWCRITTSGGQIIGNRFSWTGGWDGATLLASVPSCARSTRDWLPDPPVVGVGISDAGVATVLYIDDAVKYRRFDPATSTGWTAAEALASSAEVVEVSLSVSSGGQALAAWRTDAFESELVEACAFSPADGWSETALIAGRESKLPTLRTGVDAAGRGFVVYVPEGGSANVARFNGTSFLASQSLGSAPDYEVDLAVASSGVAYLARAWAQRDLLVTRYEP